MKLKDIKIDRYIGKIIAISGDLYRMKDDNSRLRKSAKQHMLDRFATINSLCNDYLIGDNSEAQKIIIFHAVKKEIDKMRSEDNLSKFEEIINEHNEKIIMKLRSRYNDLTDETINLCVLLCAGLTPKTISVITGMKLKTIYTKRSRLKQRLESDNWEERDLMLSCLY